MLAPAPLPPRLAKLPPERPVLCRRGSPGSTAGRALRKRRERRSRPLRFGGDAEGRCVRHPGLRRLRRAGCADPLVHSSRRVIEGADASCSCSPRTDRAASRSAAAALLSRPTMTSTLKPVERLMAWFVVRFPPFLSPQRPGAAGGTCRGHIGKDRSGAPDVKRCLTCDPDR